MNRKLFSISATILFGVLLLFNFPSLAQVYPQVIPRVEVIKTAYRLVISRPQDDVYVLCPTDFEPELNYLRNVKTIQCKPFSSLQK
ncbi:hypothetical protein [Leptolyngbya sp. NIES-2104]|uniref:hypothetical protein n=1 Tax=Leptolyngbya sp. NIES-2104 TaxID=1552121 RepID=UPI0006EC4B95|nr:hypothetical protein [Leptolyngbya sp. NIES-2104]GAP99937.1 hypothetical protein NIES2104_65030 [Leptolyngbya sp. NIES-2104]